MRRPIAWFLSLFSLQAMASITLPTDVHPDLVRGNLNVAEQRLSSALSENGLDDRVTVERIGNTHYLFATTAGRHYLTSDKGDTLAPVNGRDIYTLDGGMRRYNLSNDAHNQLMAMEPLWSLYHDKLPYYGPTGGQERKGLIYTFVDFTCGYCKNFHMRKMEKYREEGYAFIHIPFLKDPSNLASAQLAIDTFCGDKDGLKERIIRAYQNSRPQKTKDLDFSRCDIAEQSLLKNTLLIGARLGFIGSPMFITESGSVAFGEPSLGKITK